MTLPKQILARCPSCLENFINLLCHSTCGPHQSRYMLAVNSTSEPTLVTEVHYAVSHGYAYGLFNSCYDVINPSTNEKALNMLCGMDAKYCTPELWLDFLGNPQKNILVPFPIHYHISNDNITVNGTSLDPMNDDILPCNETCSCQDCSAVCKPIPPYVPPTPRTLLGLPYMYVIMGACFIGFLLLFGSYAIFRCLYRRDYYGSITINGDHSEPFTHKDVSCYERIGAGVEAFFERGFGRWGLLCARYPITVIVATLVVCGALSAGIALFQVVTDPVELWSAPDSRARQEKDYFEENFT